MTGKLLNNNDIIELLRDGVKQYNLMTPKCFESLVVKGNLDNMDCLTAFLSKVLGLGIVVGSSLVKLPQVFKIMFGRSAEGISFLSVLLELMAITLSGLYSFASSAIRILHKIVNDHTEDEESLLTKFNKNYITIEHMTSTSRELVGLQVWRGAFLLADYILHNYKYFKHKNVLELASGVGLTAIVASLVSKSVVATDVDRENILSLLESNIRKNTTTDNVTVQELDFFWDKYPENLATRISDCDIVLAADVVYVEAITTNFVKTIKNILSYGEKSKTVLIALEKRREVTKDGEIVAPYYAHFEKCLLELKGEVMGEKCLEMQELKIDFPQYFEYTRVPELTLWRIRQI